MSRCRTRLAMLVLVLAALAGCVRVPTEGPVERVAGSQPPCQNCVNVEVAPPSAGDEPRQIVEGYLRATSNYQPNYSVARQFLTKAASEKWSPEVGVLIYRGSPAVDGDTVKLDKGRLVGSLGSDRVYTAADRPFTWDFKMVRENNEWRISRPPPGLMVAEYSFATFFSAYELYFVGNGVSLVPEQIYLPVLRNQANIASALVKALIGGPSGWLAPAVTSAIPPDTTLAVDSVTITDGIATVPLSDGVGDLADPARSLLAAQLVYTLKQVAGVKAVLITVGGQKLRVPESDPISLAVSVTSVSPDVDPVPFVVSEQLFVVRDGAVGVVDTAAGQPVAEPVKGPLGNGGYRVDSVAVSVSNTDLAAVTDGGTTLRTAPIASGQVRTAVRGATDLLRPQYSRYGELWSIGRKGGRQRLWLTDTEGTTEVRSTLFARGEVLAFKIAPAGARMAVLLRTGRGTELGIARIARSDRISVDGWRRLNITQTDSPQLTRLVDVAWLNATDLLVLGAATKSGPVGPYRVSEDASQVSSEGEPDNWDARQVTVLLRNPAAVVVGRSGQTWIDDGTDWMPYLDRVQAAAFPG